MFETFKIVIPFLLINLILVQPILPLSDLPRHNLIYKFRTSCFRFGQSR